MTGATKPQDSPCDAADAMVNPTRVSTKVKKQDGMQTPGLILPMGLVALQIAMVKRVWAEEGQIEYTPETNPFAKCSWIPPLVMSVGYLAVIFGGQRYMRDRAPLDDLAKPYMLLYNLYQTVFNSWWIVMTIMEVYSLGYPLFGLPLTLTREQFNLGFLIWLHYQNKYLEMMDTMFMVMRKKTKQISFLHCYHHLLLLWVWWIVCANGCGGECYFGALMNSIIHVLMYGYYFLSTLKIPVPWKKYLTKLQMLQFAVCLTHTLYAIYYNIYPRWLCLWEVWVMTNMLYLFNQFYKQAYKAKQARKRNLANKNKGGRSSEENLNKDN
ncbi:hypothetical protein AAMO2058_000610100 [Amorphochlora amoebiformis]|mmetsp:Transcript_22703/g.35661  ORF Transcript_22703/g.35661 Transcript_22703/m.35661 type:complete len:325 (-) Transcript_22703:202-1176(-)